MGIRGEYMVVSVGELQPNDYNPNQQSEFMFERQQKSIQQMNFLDPCLVRTGNEEGDFGHYQILDGEHRWRAAQKVGESEVSVINLGTVPDIEAKKLTILLNDLRGENERTRMAALINELVEHAADDVDQLKETLPFTEAEFNAFAEMTIFDWSTLDDANPDTTPSEGPTLIDLSFKVPAAVAEDLRRAMKAAAPKDDAQALQRLALAFLGEEPAPEKKLINKA